MSRRWWPESFYEVRPYAALVLGLLTAVVALVRAWAIEHWEVPVMVIAGIGCAAFVYGAAVLQMRGDYRRRSRWRREKGP